MIIITVKLWPKGRKSEERLIGQLGIANDGTGDKDFGNYAYELRGKEGRVMKKGEIKEFPRLRLHVWDLIARVLRDADRG